jgi:hypothetical protein
MFPAGDRVFKIPNLKIAGHQLVHQVRRGALEAKDFERRRLAIQVLNAFWCRLRHALLTAQIPSAFRSANSN